MGIQGLLPQLKSITAKAHVSKFRGKRAAVDAYVLLHRGAYTCAREIVEGEPGAERRVPACLLAPGSPALVFPLPHSGVHIQLGVGCLLHAAGI